MSIPTTPHHSPRIAIVEDDADQRFSLEEYLTLMDYPVWSAASAEAFYRRVLLEPVDVLVLDVGLPGEDGINLTQHMVRTGMGIIIVSARGELSDRLTGIDAGADSFLVKPVDLPELVAHIQALWRRISADNSTEHRVESTWRLCRNPRELRSPQNQSVHLTPSEFTLLTCLVKQQGEASRESISVALGNKPELFNSHRIDVLLNRLRKKVLQGSGMDLPLASAPLQRLTLTSSLIFE